MLEIAFFYKVPPTPQNTPLSLHDALPIYPGRASRRRAARRADRVPGDVPGRSEEHTSEQSRSDLVCRLLLEKKKTMRNRTRERGLEHEGHRCRESSPCSSAQPWMRFRP